MMLDLSCFDLLVTFYTVRQTDQKGSCISFLDNEVYEANKQALSLL